jgi:probable rRNA maturation factor
MAIRLVIDGGPHPGVSRTEVARRARAMLDAVQLGRAELSVLLTGDAEIQQLNRTYRKKNRPTDVLAFAQREVELGEKAGRILGDVVVSVPTARRQAEARGLGVMSELTMLLAHGLLHLLGWDHDTAAKDRRMRRETNRLCVAADAASVAARDWRTALRGQRAPAETPRARANANSTVRDASGRARPAEGLLRVKGRAHEVPTARTRGEFAKQAVFPLRHAKSRC